LKTETLINYYRNEGFVQSIGEIIKPNQNISVQLKGLSGSLDAIILSAIYLSNHQNHLVILHDKEEAAYFQNDLQSCLLKKDVMLFPTSYKKPYRVEEIENANVLMRAEILNRINNKAATGEIIVTYSSALSEKVINKRSLKQNTLKLKSGDVYELEKLRDRLISFDFELTDFVYEAGQFSIRGGIVDIFSYANELPYRIELFGNEIDSLRTFNPESQLSVKSVREINIIPNIQTQLQQESRESFLNFIPNNTKIWLKDYEQACDTIDLLFQKATNEFETLVANSGNTHVISDPVSLFETKSSFDKMLKGYTLIEFGNRFYFKKSKEFHFN